MGFDALIPATQSGNIDMIAAGINATPEREKALAFSEPYSKKAVSSLSFVKIIRISKKMDDLTNKRVGVQLVQYLWKWQKQSLVQM